MTTLVVLKFDEDGLHANVTPAMRLYAEYSPDEFDRLAGLLEGELRAYADQIGDSRARAAREADRQHAALAAAAADRRAREAAAGRAAS